MHGVIKRENRGAEVIDFCHGVPPQDVTVAGLFLQAAVTRFPVGTVHVAVVDPGVGTSRRCLGLVAHGCYWLAPDNGVLTAFFDHADELLPAAAVEKRWDEMLDAEARIIAAQLPGPTMHSGVA